MLWMTDLEWSFIGNDNGAGVVYCYGKHTELFMTKQREKKPQVFLLWVSFLASPFFHAYWYMWINLCKWTRIKSPAVSGSYMLATPLKKCIIIGFEVGLIKLVISPCYFLWNTFLFIYFFLFNSTWLTLVPCHPILSAFSPFYSVKCCFFYSLYCKVCILLSCFTGWWMLYYGRQTDR